MCHRFTKYHVLIAVAGLLAPTTAQTETLITHYFEGDVSYSTSSLVAVGHRLTGTFTYDLDWKDRVPDNPNLFVYLFPPGWAVEPFPVGSPIGMSYTVGSLSHHTAELAELIIDNDSFDEDGLYFGSDALMGPSGPCCIGGYIDFRDPTGTAFSSDHPPATLDLATFAEITFWGTDGQRDFLATIHVLRVVPEPATLMLLVAGSLVGLAARVPRRRQCGGNNALSP